jgi:hypothetical protein
MSVGLILNLLNELNKIILCEPLASITLFYLMSSIDLVLNLHKYNILFITYSKRERFTAKMSSFHWRTYSVTLTLARFNAIFIYDANDITSKCYYTSVISFLLHGFITLLCCSLYDKYIYSLGQIVFFGCWWCELYCVSILKKDDALKQS